MGRALAGCGPALACANFLTAQGFPRGALLAHPKGPPDVAPEGWQSQHTIGDPSCSG